MRGLSFLYRERVTIILSLLGWVGIFHLFGEPFIHQFVYSRWPVIYDWRVGKVEIRDGEAWITGTMKKRWSCDYVTPPRAADAFTLQAIVVVSRSVGASQSWAPTDAPRAFGPWVMKLRPNESTEFFVQHRCSGVDVFSRLGVLTISASGIWKQVAVAED